MSKRGKKKPRRRELQRVERKSAVVERTPDSQLRRAARVATTMGGVAVLAALAIQYRILPADVGGNGILVLKVAGGALVIAGFILGRGTKAKPA